MTTQTIFNTAPTSNFTQLHNGLLESAIPPKPKSVLFYLLSKPSSWRLRVADLKNRLGLSTYGVRQALQWLQMAGYLYYERSKSGHTTWFVHNTPQTRVVEPHVEIPHVENQPDLVIPRQTVILEQPPEHPSIPQEIVKQEVVVSSDSALEYPKQLTPAQHKQCKHIIKKCEPSLQQAVLTALALAMIANKVKCPPAYLSGLIKRANNGLFEPVEQPQTVKRTIPLWKDRVEPPKVDNEAYFKDLITRFGDRAAKVVTKFGTTA